MIGTTTLGLGRNKISVSLVALVIGLALFSAPAQATQTGNWNLSDFAGTSNTGGNVTTVTVEVETYQRGGWWPITESYFSLDGGGTLQRPENGVYTPDVNGDTGLQVTYNPGDNTTNTRITFTFSNPVTNPVLHLDRLGGQSGGTNTSAWTLSMSASTGATSLTRLSGVSHFTVDNNNARFRGSYNQNANSGWNGDCRTSARTGAACGSVRINGTFSTLVFDVRMLGDAGSGDAVTLAFTFNQDLGDAPSSYGRALHAMPQVPTEAVPRYLGANPPDDDAAGNEYSANADHDDNTGTADEDGVIIPNFAPGQTKPVTVTVDEPATGGTYLQAWMDWNHNGGFDNGERIANNVADNGNGDQDNQNGTITLNVAAPSNASPGTTIARFRWSSEQSLGATGNAADGEVEDHAFNVVNLVSCPTGSTATGSGLASSGSGPYRGSIYWLDWSCGSRDHFSPGATVAKTWRFGPLEIRATLRDLNADLNIYRAGDWSGDKLDDLYSGVNPIGLANPSGQETSFNVDWEVYFNSHRVDANIIVADAEDTDDGEFLQWNTDGDPWRVFAVWPGSDLQVRFGNGARHLRLSSLPGNGEGTLLAMSEGVGGTHHVIHGSGIQATAFGVFVAVDYGDLPEGYPESGGHFLLHEASGGDQPTSDTDANTLTLAAVSARPPYLGELPPDGEGGAQHAVNADADGPEEDGVTFPNLVPGSTVNLTVKITENTPGSGYLQGWIDWNQDGDFGDAGEQVALNVRDNDTQDTDGTAGTIALPVWVPPGAVRGTSYARFRFADAPDLNAGGIIAYGGEIEDSKVTIAPPATGGVLAGQVFNDNGADGGTAHNGVRDGGEPGIAAVPVRLLHDADGDGRCAGGEAVIAQDRTDGNGGWRLVPLTGDIGKAACLLVGTPAGHRAVSENNGGHALTIGTIGDNAQTLTVPATGIPWQGIAFGEVPLPLLHADGQGSIAPGGAILYSHRFIAGSAGQVDFAVTGAASSPASPAWAHIVYRDDNCNGQIDGGDAQLPTQGVSVTAGDQLCLLLKVFAPANAPLDARDNAPLVARQALTGTAFEDSVTVTDLTRVVLGRLLLEKTVRNLGPDGQPGTADDGDANASHRNRANPGDVLRYTLRFSNPGSRALTDVAVHDFTPAFTGLIAAAACPATLPAGLIGCAVAASDGANAAGYQGSLSWAFSGQLPPGATGELHYDVRVNP